MTQLPPFSSLLSPPEPTMLGDFGQQHQQAEASKSTKMAMPKQIQKLAAGPLSPPISPPIDLAGRAETTDAHVGTDPVLYPEESPNTDAAAPALFPESDEKDAGNRVQHQVSSKSGESRHTLERSVVNGTERIRFGTSSWSSWGSGANGGDIMAHLYSIREYNRMVRERMEAAQGKPSVQEDATTVQTAPIRSQRRASPGQYRVAKPGRPAVAQTSTLAHTAASRKPRPTPAPARKAPRNMTPIEKAAPKKKFEDVNFASLRDVSPSISTLRDRDALKVDRPADNPLDLQNDPHRDELDKAELELAASLRLTCAVYLCSKRRIFLAFLENLKMQKGFKKTDAQQACNIDVNKASKLHTAYDRVGWFEKHHFEHLL